MEELKLKKCLKCGALVKVLQDCNCEDGIICCKEKMHDVIANSTDASFEKHVPTYQKENDEMIITVNHVMEEDHYIEWILVKYKNENKEVFFKPGDQASVRVPYEKGALIYSYCNKHGLWKCEVM